MIAYLAIVIGLPLALIAYMTGSLIPWGWLASKQEQWTRRRELVDERTEMVALDTWSRVEAEQRILDWQAHVDSAFREAMAGRPVEVEVAHLRAELDDDAALADWVGRGWSA